MSDVASSPSSAVNKNVLLGYNNQSEYGYFCPMTTSSLILSNFVVIRPEFESSQSDLLDWIISAHTRAEEHHGKSSDFDAYLSLLMNRVGCKAHIIHKRGHVLADFLHTNWSEMAIYQLDACDEGVSLQARQKVYAATADAIFEQYYEDETSPPSDLIHVSCTGYDSPSSPQKLVSNKKWGETTTVTHAYHMGCYASIPAIRMATAFCHSGSSRSDIVHTEICSLHLNPLLHGADQLVSQSLFADGFIKYSVSNQGSGLRILAVHESLIPNSLEAMTWQLTGWGFRFSLSKDIPQLIAQNIRKYITILSEKADMDGSILLKNALFAVHPGGPKIVDDLQEILCLRDEQLKASREVLQQFGNMSSATLPHIWAKICSDPTIPPQTKVVSLAFGPGLTIAGVILEKT